MPTDIRGHAGQVLRILDLYVDLNTTQPAFWGSHCVDGWGLGLAAPPGPQPETSSAERPGVRISTGVGSAGSAAGQGEKPAGRGRSAQLTMVGTWPVPSSSSSHSTRCLLPAQGTVTPFAGSAGGQCGWPPPRLSFQRLEGSLSEPRGHLCSACCSVRPRPRPVDPRGRSDT